MKNLPGTVDVTIPTILQIISADGQTFSELTVPLNNSWLATTSYWSKTSRTYFDNHVWNVYGGETRLNYAVANHKTGFGARPVITTLKTNLILN